MLTKDELTTIIFKKYYKEAFMINADRSVFIKTNVKNFLFAGYDICVKKYNILCLILTLKTKDNLRNMRILPNGGLRFSFFNHVSIHNSNKCKFFFVMKIFVKRNFPLYIH